MSEEKRKKKKKKKKKKEAIVCRPARNATRTSANAISDSGMCDNCDVTQM
jgi:hypothetical protein